MSTICLCVVNNSKAVRHARTQEALFSCFPSFNLTQCSSNVIHDIIWQQQTQVWFSLTCVFEVPLGVMCRTDRGQLTGFSLLNLQGYTSLVHFIYSHYWLVPSATRGPCGTRSLSYSNTLVYLAQLPALLYLAIISFSENKETSDHLLLQSGIVGCIVISQNLLLTMPEQNPF